MDAPGPRQIANTLSENWPHNHSHYGFAAWARCASGMAQPLPRLAAPSAALCFSVLPNLTALWRRLLCAPVDRVVVGDCSGGLQSLPDTTVVPLPNFKHGVKIDLFVHQVLDAEFILINDDDVLWRNPEPFHWAMEQFTDPKVAAVSLVPRRRFRWTIDGVEYRPMGSHCLVIRRDVFVDEGVSFRFNPSPSGVASYAGAYDTADYANVELIRRGHRIAIAPDEVRESLWVLPSTSSYVFQYRRREVPRDPEEAAYIVTALDAADMADRIVGDRRATDGMDRELYEDAARDRWDLVESHRQVLAQIEAAARSR